MTAKLYIYLNVTRWQRVKHQISSEDLNIYGCDSNTKMTCEGPTSNMTAEWAYNGHGWSVTEPASATSDHRLLLMLKLSTHTHSTCKKNKRLINEKIQIPTDCVGGGGGEGKRVREREKERELVVYPQYRKVWEVFFSSLCVCGCVPLILFHVMGLVPRRRNGTEKNIIINNWSNETNICNTDDLIQ